MKKIYRVKTGYLGYCDTNCEYFRNRKEVDDFIYEVEQSNVSKVLRIDKITIEDWEPIYFYFPM